MHAQTWQTRSMPRTRWSQRRTPKMWSTNGAATLLNLAESFVRGEARVDPRVYPKSCQYCPLAGVCRVAECRGTPVRGDSAEEEEAE